MTSVADQRSVSPLQPRKERIPLWRRITAAFTLSLMVILGGALLAGLIGTTILLVLFVLERAIAG